MEIKYFNDTDTLLINFTDKEITETRDLDEDILIELDKNGKLASMTIEHASHRVDIENFSFQKITEKVSV